jgi:thiamine biosynthesis lipoprotein
MERATRGAFSITATAPGSDTVERRWTLLPREFSIRCDAGRLLFDLGAIGKGFALDRMAALLREWDCHSFLLVAGGSSVLAGDKPPGEPGWPCGFGEDRSVALEQCSLSGSGLDVKGLHILDPRTGSPPQRQVRTWAIADTGAESDALSTAAMVLSESEIAEVLAEIDRWLVILEGPHRRRQFGSRPAPKHLP